jgi:hypothetical protein
LLNAFGMAIDRDGDLYAGRIIADDGSSFSVTAARAVQGGQPLARGTGGEVLAAAKRVGRGRVVAATFAERLSDAGAESVARQSPEEAQAVQEMVRRLLDAALEGRPVRPRWTGQAPPPDDSATTPAATVGPDSEE